MSSVKPSPELASWAELNKALMKGDIKLAQKLLEEEKRRPHPRKTFMTRCHSRINKLRAQQERAELLKD